MENTQDDQRQPKVGTSGWVGHRFVAKHTRTLAEWEVIHGPEMAGNEQYITVKMLQCISGPGPTRWTSPHAWPLKLLPSDCWPTVADEATASDKLS